MESFANELPICMLLGGNFSDDGEVEGWKSFGNIGSVSIFVALEKFMRTKPIQKGDNILLLVPKSGRISYDGTALVSVF